jgi:hypothetical protein
VESAVKLAGRGLAAIPTGAVTVGMVVVKGTTAAPMQAISKMKQLAKNSMRKDKVQIQLRGLAPPASKGPAHSRSGKEPPSKGTGQTKQMI